MEVHLANTATLLMNTVLKLCFKMLLVTKLIRIHFQKRRKSHQNLAVALPLCSARLGFLSVSAGDPGFKLLEVQMTSGLQTPEYWLQCLSVHYSSKLMMQGTACCLPFSVWRRRVGRKRLVFCEQHVINSLGACSLCVDDYSLWYISVYFWVHCTTSCAIFLPPPISPDRQSRRNHLGVWWVLNPII